MSESVLIIGASSKPDRYSYKALKMLEEYDHTPVLMHPKTTSIEGRTVYSSISEILEQKISVDTVTLYVNPKVSSTLTEALVELHPKRVIFNPGAENAELATALEAANIKTEEACTLVLLKTGQF